MSDPTGCATPTREVTWKYHKAGLPTVSRSDHAVMLWLLLKPRDCSLQGIADTCPRDEQGKLRCLVALHYWYTAPFCHLLSIIRVACSCFLAISHTSKCFRIKELIWAYWRKTNFYTPRNPQSKWCRIEIVHFQWFYEKHASTNTYIWLLYITLQSRPTGSSKSK